MPYRDPLKQKAARAASARRIRAERRQEAAERSAAAAPQEAPGATGAEPGQVAVPWPYLVELIEYLATALHGLPPGSRARLDTLAEMLAARLQVPSEFVLGIIRAAWPERIRDGCYCAPFAAGR